MESRGTLFFLHGWAAGPDVWAAQANCFSRWYKVIRFNYHKGIEDGLVCGDMSQYAMAALETINREPASRAFLVGWSMGALVAMELALLVPHKITGLVLIGATGRFTRAPGYCEGQPAALVKRMKKRLAQDPDRTLEDFCSRMFTREELAKGAGERFRQVILCPASRWTEKELAAGLDFLLRRDLRGHLGKINLPCLIMHGEGDEICPIGTGYYLHRNIAGSDFEFLPECGHAPFWSKAEIFNEKVGRWLDDLHR